MKKIILAFALLTLAGILFAVQWSDGTPSQRDTASMDAGEAERASVVVRQLFQACRDRDRDAALRCWVSGFDSGAMGTELQKLPGSKPEWTLLDARYPEDNRNEIWLTGTVNRNGAGCTFVLVREDGGEFRIRKISALEDMLTAQVGK